ncbi:peptide chain release factor N(5)-glutamine methyltransferase [Companilactobacillus furfuricola]|uniref:peptide chain release factor N(5)-glutamine methyltransferase n=1 Tax=Companilactobacillus furfuricola TaxID=1462575 RepID=UPI000F76D3FC|nr:peptide chain release factor N(5)-glutamine methyltransferase [Companilactobacillus furfuricola]
MERLSYSNALNRAFLMLKEAGKFSDDALYLMEELSGFNYTQLQLHRNDLVPSDIDEKFQAGLQRLLNDEPVQYILGSAYFMGRKFHVDQNVLIPRQETEEMVDQVISDNNRKNLQILDIGTGSGVIAISLALAFSDSQIVASDISNEALRVASKNASIYDCANISFVQSDLFDNLADQSFDIIVSNPPYIAVSEKDVMDESVKKYEPEVALYGQNEGLEIYQRISKVVDKHLSDGGDLYMEFGYHQKNQIEQIFGKNMPQYVVKFYKDISGNYRYLNAHRKKV